MKFFFVKRWRRQAPVFEACSTRTMTTSTLSSTTASSRPARPGCASTQRRYVCTRVLQYISTVVHTCTCTHQVLDYTCRTWIQHTRLEQGISSASLSKGSRLHTPALAERMLRCSSAGLAAASTQIADTYFSRMLSHTYNSTDYTADSPS